VANQKLVVQDVINRFRTAKLPAITFGAYKEPWKNQFGAAESQWGICQGIIPYKCTNTFK
jgi:exo-beta-1,3-glucanase (GH17 family)